MFASLKTPVRQARDRVFALRRIAVSGSVDLDLGRYKQFKEFQKRILVATDLFGRGIDIERATCRNWPGTIGHVSFFPASRGLVLRCLLLNVILGCMGDGWVRLD